jgi:hypothetical protein
MFPVLRNNNNPWIPMNRIFRTAALFTCIAWTTALVQSTALALDISRAVVILGSSPDVLTQGYSESVYISALNLESPKLIYRFPFNEFGLNSAIAPDGRSVVVASRDAASEIVHLRRLSVANGRVLSHATLDPDAVEIGFTPDAKSATFQFPTGPTWDVYLIPVTGGQARQLTVAGDVSPFAPAVIAAGRLYYCGSWGQIQSEDLFTHRHPRVFPAASYRFTVAPSGDTIIYETLDAATGAPEIDTLDTYNGFHDRYFLDDPTTLTTINLAVSQDERFVYFTNVHHGAHGSGEVRAGRLKLNTGRITYPVTGIVRPENFTTTGVNPNE